MHSRFDAYSIGVRRKILVIFGAIYDSKRETIVLKLEDIPLLNTLKTTLV